MTSASSSVSYQTRRRTQAGAARGSRVDRRRTRVGLLSYLGDSGDESDSHSSSSENDCYTEGSEEDAQGVTAAGDSVPAQGDSDEEQGVSQSCRARRKRACSTVLVDSSSDSSSDVGGQPLRKVLPKKRLSLQLLMSDSDTEAGERQLKEESSEAARKKERHRRLEELAERKKSGASRSRRSRLEDSEKENGKEQSDSKDEALHVRGEQQEDKEDAAVALPCSSEEDEDEDACVTVAHSSEEEDSDSMRDFIVDDEEQSSGEESKVSVTSLLSHHLPHMVTGSQKKHFQAVVKALLINVLDPTFLKSLYDGIRTKRYALQMKDSLYHLDHHYVLPHLENLKGRSRWSERYKERVDCYPNVRILKTGGRDRMCEACELHRSIRFHVRLSGQLYDFRTLQDDTFLPNDIQVFRVGSVCAHRTEVYHQLKHFKYHLYCRCREVLKQEEACCGQEQEESVKEVVNRVFARLQDRGWITEQYKRFEEQQHAAIYFQDEKLN